MSEIGTPSESGSMEDLNSDDVDQQARGTLGDEENESSDTENNASEAAIDNDWNTLEKLAKDTAVGDTMYDKRWVIKNILEVGKHFQTTSYLENDTVRELDPEIEERMCTLWDISVEEDVSKFYIQYGVLDIFTELFSNPNVRVKEISVGLMANMLYHESVFISILEKDKYLEQCLKLLEERDSPTLLFVFRCLHSYGFNLFNLLNNTKHCTKEEAKYYVERWLIFLSLESVVQNIGMILAGCTNHQVLQYAARFLSILAELWDHAEERRKVAQFYTEEQFIQCVTEAIAETVREDKTEKHFLVFLYLVFERDVAKDVYFSVSNKIIQLLKRLCSEHILEYGSIDEYDLEFIFHIGYILKLCLDSGEFTSITSGLKSAVKDVKARLEKADIEETHSENKQSILGLLDKSIKFMEVFMEQNGGHNSSQESQNGVSGEDGSGSGPEDESPAPNFHRSRRRETTSILSPPRDSSHSERSRSRKNRGNSYRGDSDIRSPWSVRETPPVRGSTAASRTESPADTWKTPR